MKRQMKIAKCDWIEVGTRQCILIFVDSVNTVDSAEADGDFASKTFSCR